MNKQNGFTLVEIAIVLVVIGLLLGGVLKGQELLENGRIRKALNDFNTVAAATFTYQDRYRRLPGDDDEAERFDGVTDSEDGDDDGVINGDWNIDTGDVESRHFWLHLRADGLIEGGGTDQPANAFNGITGVMFGNYGIANEHVICMDNVTAKSAVIMDTRIDDGSVGNTTSGGTTTGPFATGTFRIDAAPGSDGTQTGAPTQAVDINSSGRTIVCREL